MRAKEYLITGFDDRAADATSEKPRAVERAKVDEEPAVSFN